MRGGRKVAAALVIAMCFVVSTVGAVELTVGPRISAGYATFYGSDYADELDFFDASRSFHLGLQIGAFLEVAINENFAIQPELAFVRGGAQESGTDNTGDYDATYTFNYIGFPVLFKGMFPSGNGRIVVFGGPQLKFQIGDASIEFEYDNSTDDGDYDDELNQGVVISGLVGAGYDFPVGPGRLSVEVRGDIDLNSVFDPDETVDSEFRGLAALLSVGYGFEL